MLRLPMHTAAILLVALLPWEPGIAQTPPAQAPPVRVTTRLVQVNVIVTDRDGKPVKDLTRDDFVVYDQGQSQMISLFTMETVQRSAPADSTADAAAPPAPLVYSNRLEQAAGVPTSITVILLDGLNTRILDQNYARNEVIKFLQQIQPEDRIALYALDMTGLKVLHDFTRDASRLLAALDRYRQRDPAAVRASNPETSRRDPTATGVSNPAVPVPTVPGASPSEDFDFDTWLNSSNQQAADYFMANRVRQTVDALALIGNHVTRLPGRKNLVWVSSTFPFDFGLDRIWGPITKDRSPTDRQIFVEEIQRAARILNSANLAVYPVDARGLLGPWGEVAASSVGFIPREAVGRGPVGQMATVSTSGRSTDTMRDFAERTGGRAFYNTNDIKGAVRKAIADSEVTYSLGYYANHNEWDGRFRKIKVEVKRPGLQARYRQGYFALPDQSLGPQQSEALLREIATSPLDATGVGITLRPAILPGSPLQKLQAQIVLATRELGLAQQGGEHIGRLQLLLVQRTGDGRVVASAGEALDIAIPDAAYPRVLENGLAFTRTMDLSPAAHELRVAIREVGSGSVGSVTVPLRFLTQAARKGQP